METNRKSFFSLSRALGEEDDVAVVGAETNGKSDPKKNS